MDTKFEIKNRIACYSFVQDGSITLEELARHELNHVIQFGFYHDSHQDMDEGLYILYHLCRRIETHDKDERIKVHRWN